VRELADGSQIIVRAALDAGCNFFAGYPITPATGILLYMMRELPRAGGIAIQGEDEIASIGFCGPGMSLKTEILGLASIPELPLLMVNVQRGGPSTGIPTKSEQSDLFQAAFSAHGDAVRPVLAPIDVADTFPITVEAFNIAERYQTPVIILSDQEIAQRKEAIERPATHGLKIETRRTPT